MGSAMCECRRPEEAHRYGALPQGCYGFRPVTPVDWVTVSDWLWHAAMREMDPAPGPDQPYREPSTTARSEYPRALVQAVVDYLGEDLTCDHSVNICMCGPAAVVEELLLNLQGRETCRACGGEGFTWNQARYEASKREWESKEPNNWYNFPDDEGYEACERCNRKGVVLQSDE